MPCKRYFISDIDTSATPELNLRICDAVFCNKGYQSCMNCGEGFKYFDVIHDGRWWPSKPYIPWKYGFLWFDGLRDLRDRFCRGLLSQCTMALAKQEVQLIWIGRAFSQKPGCINCDIVTTNLDRSVLITIITWHFEFVPWMLVFST